MYKGLKTIGVAILLAFLAVGLAACEDEQGPAEEAGENVDESMDDAGEEMEETGEEMEEAAEEE
ncbi:MULTISPECIES: hypothetical protein [unclassified Halomonas]|uniref:hypothetical protein n=1 Tax=unclassified Halomonas TaxID=2609666 RepID=UPI0006DA745C|nr:MULTISPECIES: hypothetical protein [unclassified Halomonas]KPQ20491.1 MAG: hypothetical protein HLUCCO06_03550 [Halomonas sp. HL-93]SBR46254.1 hypothetical protein GA0071314_0627 [Halomonas sp. HL-93]SNY98654.1 hypothetical protein SAMN04488142_3280 [Halomonas sp. hl-4]